MIPIRSLLVPAAALGLVSAAVPARAISVAGYGFRMGIAAARIHGDYGDASGSQRRVGFACASFARVPVSGPLSLQPEIGWASKGADDNFTGTVSGGGYQETFGFPIEHRIEYLEIPILLRVDVPTGSWLEPHFLMGPEVAIRTGGDRVTGPYTFTIQPSPRVQGARIFEEVGTVDNPRYRNVDWSMIGGVGLALGRAPLRIVVDSRYALGLAGIFPDSDRSLAHNGAWITTLGIELR